MLFLGTGTCWRGVAVFILKAGAATTTSDSLIRRSLGKSQKKIKVFFEFANMNAGIPYGDTNFDTVSYLQV